MWPSSTSIRRRGRLRDHPGAPGDAARAARPPPHRAEPDPTARARCRGGGGGRRVPEDDKPRRRGRRHPPLSDHLFTTDRRTITALCESAEAPTSTASNNHRPSNLLTRRERDILALLDRVDLPTASDRLGISVNTTRGYVKNLYRKLDVHSQVELLAVARDRGLLDEPAG